MKLLSEGIRDWLDQYKRRTVKPSTFDRLETSYHALLEYPLAYISLCDLTAEDFQIYVNSLVDAGYALSTIRKQYFLVHAYLEYASAEGLIQRPVQNLVRLPSQTVVKKPKKEIMAYSDAEQRALIQIFETGERIGYNTAWLMMETGMRVGEALALTWEDVDWRRRAIHVNKTMIRIANRRQTQVQNGAKSYTSNRLIPLSTVAHQILLRMYECAQDPHGWIFADEFGEPLSYEALRYQIQGACRKANVPYLGQHVFRHTFATNCYHRDCNVKILSKLLGHADVTVTYNVYIHLFGDALEEMRSVIG